MAVKRWSFIPVGQVTPIWWVAVAIPLLVVDYLAGPYFQFPTVYVLPVALAAWFSGLAAGLALAVLFPLARLTLMLTVFGEPWDASTSVATAVTRIVVFAVMAAVSARLATHERALSREVQTLRSLLVVCTYCSRIRDDADHWDSLEDYVAQRKGDFSEGLCPDCAQERFPEHFPPRVSNLTGSPKT